MVSTRQLRLYIGYVHSDYAHFHFGHIARNYTKECYMRFKPGNNVRYVLIYSNNNDWLY